MPGLLIPVVQYEIESEAQHQCCWEGTISEYVQLLGRAYAAAKEANPRAKIILSGVNFGDIFDDFPSPETVEKRMDSVKREGRNDVEFIRETLRHSDIYDIVEFHWNRDYKGAYGVLGWIRKYSDRPVWAGDAQSGPWIVPSEFPFVPLYPKEGYALFRIISDKTDTMHKEVVSWLRREQAKLTVKRLVTGIGAGLKGLNLENINDWGMEWAKMGLGNYMFMGILDSNFAPKPAYYTYKLAITKLKGYSSVERLNIDNDILQSKGKGVWAFKFIVGNKPLLVLWYEDNINSCPICENKEEASITVDLSQYVSTQDAKIIHIITEDGRMDPKIEIKDTKNILVTETPIFLGASK
jgi:hypothetical protein